jgi:hypothetical protein
MKTELTQEEEAWLRGQGWGCFMGTWAPPGPAMGGMGASTYSPTDALKRARSQVMSKREREYREITVEDVGRSVFPAFGRQWPVSDFIGRIYSVDIGKRVYRTSEHVVSVENAEQFMARLAAEERSQGGSHAAGLARLVCKFLSELHGPSFGIDLVRPPNPKHDHAIAVLFADGKDVVVRFESGGK